MAANISQLKTLAKSRIPGFVYDYLCGGFNEDLAVSNNRRALDNIYLQPTYLTPAGKADTSVEILGQTYASPIGVAPLSLSVLIWSGASTFQAKAAKRANQPFILSRVASISIEQAVASAEDCFWFQLYPPTVKGMFEDMLKRVDTVGCKQLMVAINAHSLARRPRDKRAGLSLQSKMNLRSLSQIMTRPAWPLSMVKHGKPEFETIKPYLNAQDDMTKLSNFIRNTLKDVVDIYLFESIRTLWPHKLIVKGILNEQDAELVKQAGADAIILSNHGGRQLDDALLPVGRLPYIRERLGDQLPMMADSGVEPGVDLARFLAQGADMVFAGRAFMYGVGALGTAGAEHIFDILQTELLKVLEQLLCPHPNLLKNFRIE
ncbi:MAG: isopentenyl diphosphate isomerase/L-lactate dehydrogenase-like FMN-dependent dehydrogenase [Gammaproteobacteria bacterium]|jgi:isopentenyl diphosphate isomerase/L-lactate dehydrogenase-like FMN-dependent dehydrogenase